MLVAHKIKKSVIIMNITRISKFFFVFHALFAFTCYAAPHITMVPLLQVLLDDMKLYKLDSAGEPYLHAGDLYEHSLWTYNAMIELLEDNSPYAQDLYLSEHEKEIVTLVALLHDVGKAGREELFNHTHAKLHYDVIKNSNGSVASITYYQDRQEHPRISFEYAVKPLLTDNNKNYTKRDYHLINKDTGTFTSFDMKALYAQLDLTNEEQKIIAILVGIHYEFGNVKHGYITPAQFLTLLENLVKTVNYNDSVVNEKIIRLAILIQVADVKGLTPISAHATPLFAQGTICQSTHYPLKFNDPFQVLGYTCQDTATTPRGVQAMHELLAYFHEQQHAEIYTPAYAIEGVL